ncbi:hypothetical protein HPB51_012817 [Rhipicephalus microplus]|uniref:RING-type domain-containing protein n=1 Tax=Rhipicephalus microplus TaxID=6941 RepID=A0A9J6EA22_RHIMP|nr:hypothetical protein HPB51_012817 [Rhipicephalus microplus]
MADRPRSTGSGWEYTLTGFGEFLEMGRVTFVKPVPSSCICSACGVLPSRIALLPCGHVFCESCKAKLQQEEDCWCPFDGKKFAYCGVHPMTVERRELEQRRVVGSAIGHECAASAANCPGSRITPLNAAAER